MAVTVNVYNQAASLFAQGLINVDGPSSATDVFSSFKVALYVDTNPTFTASSTTLTDFLTVDNPSIVEVVNSNYTAGGNALVNPAITLSGNDATFDADDFTVTAAATDIQAGCALLYRTSYTSVDANDRPLLLITFGGTETASAGTDFKIVWSANGIFSFVVAG